MPEFALVFELITIGTFVVEDFDLAEVIVESVEGRKIRQKNLGQKNGQADLRSEKNGRGN